MTQENDIVLIYFEEQPLTFARIERILPDVKPDWYHVQLLMLQVPVQVVTWILRDIYINGQSFTMDGKQVRLERVVAPREVSDQDGDQAPKPTRRPPARGQKGTKVISLADLKKT